MCKRPCRENANRKKPKTTIPWRPARRIADETESVKKTGRGRLSAFGRGYLHEDDGRDGNGGSDADDDDDGDAAAVVTGCYNNDYTDDYVVRTT